MTGLEPGPVPALGEPVRALGAPLGVDFTLTRGMVSASARQVETAVPLRLLQHDAAVDPGSSGGSPINAAGRVVGMNSRTADGSRRCIGLSFAIAAPDLARIVQGLIDATLLPTPDLGLHLRPESREVALAVGVARGGILVGRVATGSIADRAGIAAGDTIEATAGQALPTPGDPALSVDAALPAASLSVTLRRADGPLHVLLTFDPAESTLALRDTGSAQARVASCRSGQLGITPDITARATDISDNSPALFAGLATGDRILRLNGATLDAAALRTIDNTAPALLLTARDGGTTMHLMLDPWDTGGGLRPTGGANVPDPDVARF